MNRQHGGPDEQPNSSVLGCSPNTNNDSTAATNTTTDGDRISTKKRTNPSDDGTRFPVGYTPAKALTTKSSEASAIKAASLAFQSVKGTKQPMSTAAEVADYVNDQSGHSIPPRKIQRIVREGNAGITPGKPKVEACQGIHSGIDNKTMAFVAKRARRRAQWVVDTTANGGLEQHVSTARANSNLPVDVMQFVEQSTSDATVIQLEDNGLFVIRAKECTPKQTERRTSRCAACNGLRSRVTSEISICRPIGAPVEEVKTTTNVKHIAADPEVADFEIRRLRGVNEQLRRENIRLKAAAMLDSNSVVIHDLTKADMMDKVLKTAVEKVGEAYPGDSNEDARDLLQIYYEHVHKQQPYYSNGGKKNQGFRCHPMLFQFAVMVLAKTSHSVYKELAKVMCLPSLSYVSRTISISSSPLTLLFVLLLYFKVLRKQKQTMGTQGSHHGVRIEAIADLSRSLDDIAKVRKTTFGPGSNERPRCPSTR